MNMKPKSITIDKIVSSKFFRFCIIGGFCTSLNLVSLYALTTILKVHYILSTIILMLTVNTLGFYLNRRFTFKSKKKRFWHELWKYHTVMFSSSLTVLILMYVLVDIFHIWYLYANIITTIIMIFYNFSMHKRWSFK